MPRINDIHSFTVPAEDGDLYDINYTEIMGGASGCTMLVNNVLVNVAPVSNIILKVSSVSATTGCYLGGEKPWFESGKSFISTWSTSNISSGSSTATQIKLPLVSTGTYRFIVEWGDGTSSKITSWNQAETTHTYALAGIYQIKITGICQGWTFANTGDRLKFLSVQQWGILRPGNNTAVFMNCTNLTLNDVRDVLDTTGMTSFYYLFQNCASLSRVNRINEWNTSGITYMGQAFDSCINFNDNIGNWDTSNVTTFDRMFCHAGEFNNGGSPDINNWNTENVTFMRFMFGTDGTVPGCTFMKFNQPIGNWNTSKVTNMSAVFSRNKYFNHDIGTKVVTKNGLTYTAWDTLNVTDMSFMFNGFIPNNTMLPTFNNGGSSSIGNWNTSKLTSLLGFCQNQSAFNQDISTKEVTINGVTYLAWDTLNVTTMSNVMSAYQIPGVFNQNIGNWNTSKVTSLSAAFLSQKDFNYNINTKVVTVGSKTYIAWDTSNVTTLNSAFGISFGSAGQFNQNIGNWNTSKVTNLANAFYAQPLFNQDISTKIVTVSASTYTAWDMSNVTTLNSALGIPSGFKGEFNQNIENWNTSKVTLMNSLFQNQPAFNQNISTKTVTVGVNTYTAWNTSNVTTIRYMLYNNASNPASQFNQNIGNWNTSKVTEMISTFYNTSNFNQNLGNWVVSGVTGFNSTTVVVDTFANGIGLSTTNYDALLIGWATRPVKPNLAITFGTVKYSSAAVAARAVLTSTPNNWTIIDGGLI